MCAEKFGVELNGFQRVFIMREDDDSGNKNDIGAGVLELDRGTVFIKHIITDKPFLYFDLLTRSLLAEALDMPNIYIKIKKDTVRQAEVSAGNGYFLRFGFKENGENLEVLSNDIDLSGSCCNK